MQHPDIDPKGILKAYIIALQEENTTYTAQIKQQHARISELETHLITLHELNLQLEGAGKFKDKQTFRIAELEQRLSVARSDRLYVRYMDTNDPTLFEGESLARLREWKRNIECCIDYAEDREREQRRDGEEEREAEQAVDKTVLPLSQLGLSGCANQNHRSPQKYPESRPKEEERTEKRTEKKSGDKIVLKQEACGDVIVAHGQ